MFQPGSIGNPRTISTNGPLPILPPPFPRCPRCLPPGLCERFSSALFLPYFTNAIVYIFTAFRFFYCY